MEEMYNVSSNPHVRDKMTTSRIMQLVVIALLPATLFGIWNFGFHALLVVLVTVISSVFFEWLYDRLMHKKNTINDFSAVVTGLLLALNMPPQIPLAGDTIEIQFGGGKNVKVEVLEVKDTVRKEDAENLYKYL